MKIHSENKNDWLKVGEFTISRVDGIINIECKGNKAELSRDDAIILINYLERWVNDRRNRN